MRRLLSPAHRDRSRLLLQVLSGALAAATGAGTVAATAVAAHETAQDQAVQALSTAAAEAEAARAHAEALAEWAAENPVVVTTPRPQRTVVGPEVRLGASVAGSATVGGRPSSEGSSGRVSAPPPPPAPAAKSTGS